MKEEYMKILKTIAFLLLSWVLATTLVFADAKPNYSKLDPMLRVLSQKAISLNTAKALNMLKEVPNQESMVKTLIKFKENLNGVDALGGKIGSITGDIATVDIPLSSLEALSQLENIVYVEASKKVKPKLDISVPETRATLLRGGTPPAWSGITGKNVIVGIVDTGIDLTHPDFKDATGKTRILYLLDQTTGQECTNTEIDKGTCYEIDTDGHGTHVAGIAAGNGSASNYKYVGMAPEAKLIIVNTTFDETDVLNGISYIQQKAAFLREPSVINLSLGQHVDPHDGTSNFSKGLDNASGPGGIIVGAAGNEADAGIHASGNVTQGSQTLESFNVPRMQSMVRIDIWYSGSDSMNVEVITPTCGNTGWIAPNENQNFTKACGNISISSLQNNPSNGDNEILIIIENPSAGRWNFSLQGSSITNGRFDAWIDDTVTYATFVHPDSSITLTDVGSTTRIISVGSYVTRPLYFDDPPAGNISTFSSHGPRRSCSTCENAFKPDIAAPGQWIMSALSKDYVPEPGDVVDSSGEYILFQGTSMSSPHVAGAVALMFQAKPTFTPEDIKYYLLPTTKVDQYTGNVPNYVWGYGKLDAYDAFLALSSQYTLTVNINPTGEGSVSESPNKSNYNYGDQVQITATPNTGYSFNNWSGDASGNTNPLTLTMSRNKTITANFSVPNISVTPTAYDFGNAKVKRSKIASFKIKNSGTAALLISTSIKGTDASIFTIIIGKGSKTIKPGKTLTIWVAFKPTSTGSKTSTLEITPNDPNIPAIDIALSGTGQ
jgi:subtilisin family serine protease